MNEKPTACPICGCRKTYEYSSDFFKGKVLEFLCGALYVKKWLTGEKDGWELEAYQVCDYV